MERVFPWSDKRALVHAQFETIHPFLDGDRRFGRLLLSLLLYERGVLKQPLLYISLFLKSNRVEYCERLMDVRGTSQWQLGRFGQITCSCLKMRQANSRFGVPACHEPVPADRAPVLPGFRLVPCLPTPCRE